MNPMPQVLDTCPVSLSLSQRSRPCCPHAQPRVIGGALIFAAFATILAGGALAQQIEPRQVSSAGSFPYQGVDQPIWETVVAAGPDRAVVAYNRGARDATGRIGWAVARRSGTSWVWNQDELDQGAVVSFDPQLAYNPLRNSFLLAGLVYPGDARVAVRHFSRTASGGTFVPWIQFELDPTLGGSDFPPLVAGFNGLDEPAGFASPTFHQEYYISWWRASGDLYYAHSTDDGLTWAWGSTGINAGRTWPSSPAVFQSGPLYVAFIYTAPASIAEGFRIARGLDNPDGTVSFTTLSLRDAQGASLSSIPMGCEAVNFFLPRFVQAGQDAVFTIPRLAVDPTDPQRLFLVYHAPNITTYGEKDCPPPSDDVDVNIYLRRLTVVGDTVTVSDPVLVNKPDPPGSPTPIDQFMPAIAVDSLGRVHVTFYGDREWPEQKDSNFGNEKFNAYYTYSDNGGLSFLHSDLQLYETQGAGDPPAGNRSLIPQNSKWEFGDYQGLNLFRTPSLVH